MDPIWHLPSEDAGEKTAALLLAFSRTKDYVVISTRLAGGQVGLYFRENGRVAIQHIPCEILTSHPSWAICPVGFSVVHRSPPREYLNSDSARINGPDYKKMLSLAYHFLLALMLVLRMLAFTFMSSALPAQVLQSPRWS